MHYDGQFDRGYPVSALIYVLSDLFSEQQHRKIATRMIGVLSIQSMVIFLLPINIFVDGKQIYTHGPAVLGAYTFVGIYIMTTITVAITYRKKMNPRRSFAILLWMLIWLGSAVIQFLNNSLLIVGFSSSLGVLILFVIMENPEANLERSLGCFNSYALTEYMKQLYERKMNFGVLEISFDNAAYFEEQGIDVNKALRKILDVVDDDVLTFKSVNLSLVMISDKPEKLKAAADAISDAFSEKEEFRKSAALILAPDTAAFTDLEELMRFLQFVHAKYKEEKELLIYADEEMIAQYKRKYLIEQQITEALAEDRVEIFLQPIYSTREKSFTSAEALVRIRKEDGQLLSPGLFIPVAEDTGQILELGERVFEKVCQLLQQVDIANLGVQYIEINLSVVQCEKTNLSDRLISIMNQYQVSPEMINLEITETASIGAQPESEGRSRRH